MDKSDYKKFRGLISDVHAFYQRDISTFSLNVWWESMKIYSVDAVSQALNRHCMNPDSGQFMPKPADVVKMLQGSTQDAALAAWAKVDSAVRRVGTYVDVVFDDPIIHRVIYDMGGWIALGTKNESDWPFVAKEFENRYRGFRSRSETPEYPGKMVGIAGAHNEKEGYKLTSPTLIGDRHKAEQVIMGGTNRPMIGISTMSEALGNAGDLLQNKPEESA